MPKIRTRASAWIPIASPSCIAMGAPSSWACCRRSRSPMRFSTAWRCCFVNVEELFRRYLEQRREMGESELVLDNLSVDEVVRIIGAQGKRARFTPKDSSGLGDWRQTLRDAEAGMAPPLERISRAEIPTPAPPPRPARPAPLAPVAPAALAAPLAPLAPRAPKLS